MRKKINSRQRQLPLTIAECVGGDIVRLGSGGQVVRVLFKHWDGGAQVREYDHTIRHEKGPEWEVSPLDAVVLVQVVA